VGFGANARGYTDSRVREEMDWQIENLRVTLFRFKPSPAQHQGCWEKVVGEAPEVVVQRAKGAEMHEEGPFRRGRLIAGQQTTRADWLYTCLPVNKEGEPAFQNAGNLNEELEGFLAIVEKYLEACPPVNRIAFGAGLMLPVDDHPAGYRVVKRLVPSLPVEPEFSRDLIFQVNDPIKSATIPDLSVNRLRNYTVRLLTFATMVQDGELLASPTELYACRLVLDFNTDAANKTELAQGKLSSLLRELEGLTHEYLAEGSRS
jgi:hypothetical protein